MALVPVNCTQCGAAIQIPDEVDKANCMYCGTALIVKDKEVNEKLLPNLFSLLENDEAIKNMEIKANSFALLNADVIIAEQILKNSHY